MRIDIINKELKSDQFQLNFINQQQENSVDNIISAKSYWLETDDHNQIEKYSQNLLRDPVDELILYKEQDLNKIDFDFLIEVSFKPGVTDNRARSTKEAIVQNTKCQNLKVATGDIYFIKSIQTKNEIIQIAENFFGNPLIQKIKVYSKNEILNLIPSPSFPSVNIHEELVKEISLALDNDSLKQLSKDKLWALELDELKQIISHYDNEETKRIRGQKNLPLNPTDLEMEIIAQSWSEHCKHKIFNAEIEYSEEVQPNHSLGKKKVRSLFKDYIFKSTHDVKNKFEKDWLVSVFKDNAGIVRYDENIDFCFKVETHNSPSALDPYGGALTGILGVNRDILGCGIGALPIANTNVLCFAPPKYSQEILAKLPKKLKNPINILKGVHKGIEDGGNKSGIPTVNGAIHFHDNYAGKPLVYCGTVGVMPQKIKGIPTSEKRHKPGDLVVVCGGSVGADGVHGATFSSLELDDNAPATAVQIGDPFTQKRLTDFLIEARDQHLFSALTDNGAGGLSSSIGEMAEHTNGATILLEKVPLKYKGLTPYEIIISESQERMSFAVPPEKIDAFMELANKRNVNPAIIGHFHNEGQFEVIHNGKVISSLCLNFLHNSLKPMKLKARFYGEQKETPWHKTTIEKETATIDQKIITLLKDHNIQSKESLVRQFDHEVKASTVIKPFITNKFSSPSDAAVMSTKLFGGSQDGAIAIGNGICPQYSHKDTYYMTQMAIDEALRNVIASGANPDFVSLCDNYCWPDPIKSEKNPDGDHKLAQLVRSAQALYDTAIVYGTPFVSGKDSMKNDFIGLDPQNNKIKISVPPTLLISALAKLDTVNDFMSSEFKSSNDLVYYIGPECFTNKSFSTANKNVDSLIPFNLDYNKKTFNHIHKLIKTKTVKSVHDVSEGGIIVNIIESCFTNNLGFKFTSFYEAENLEALLFNEMNGGFVVSISSDKKEVFEKQLSRHFYKFLGETTTQSQIKLDNQFNYTTEELFKIWSQNEY